MALKFARLNVQQHRSLIGQDLGDGTLFNPVMHKTGYIVISEWEIDQVTNTEFLWLKDLTLVDMDALPMPNTTPPQMSGYGLLIPTEATNPTLNLFPNNQFKMGGFVINFTETSQGLAIDLAYLGWEEFRQEQLNPINETTKNTFSTLWDTVAADYEFSIANPSQSKIIQL